MSATSQPPPGVVIPQRVKWKGRLAARVAQFLIVCLGATLRVRWEDGSGLGLLEGRHPGPVIFAFWHNRLGLSPILRGRFLREVGQKRPMAGLVSASRDGGFLARVLELFDVQPVRGSSSRRGAQAIREMVGWAKQGHDLTVTPDGPRGPCYTVQPGVLSMAQLSRLPLIPVACNLSRKIQLKSWDRFQIPLPFATCIVRLGPAMHLPEEMDDAAREAARAELQRRLMELIVD